MSHIWWPQKRQQAKANLVASMHAQHITLVDPERALAHLKLQRREFELQTQIKGLRGALSDAERELRSVQQRINGEEGL